MLDVSAIFAAYRQQTVLSGVSFSLGEGELLCLLGASGCGKSTLLKTLAGLHPLSRGSITLNGETLSTARAQRPAETRGIGLVFQEGALFPHMTVAGNVGYGQPRRPRRTVGQWLELVGLSDIDGRYPAQLSGGQQQRLALARALAAEPALLLLDEPFACLDASLRARLRREVRDLLKEAGVPAILVTHDPEEAMMFADRILLMNQGGVEQIGTAEELYHQPISPFVVRFFSEAHELRAQVENRLAQTPFGPLRADFSAALARVLIRPEAFHLTEAANACPGAVTARRFLGTRQLLTVMAGDNLLVSVWTPPAYRPPADGRVGLLLDERHAFAFPA